MVETECKSNKYPTWKWLVGVAVLALGFLLVRNFDSYSSRLDIQEVSNKQIIERVVRLETQYTHIIEGINDLKRSQERYFKRETR